MTRFEKEEWKVSPRDRMRVFDTEIGRLVEELTGLDTRFRFAYEKPGIAVTIDRNCATSSILLGLRTTASGRSTWVGRLRLRRRAPVAGAGS